MIGTYSGHEQRRKRAPTSSDPTDHETTYAKQNEGDWSERALRNDLSQLVQLGYLVKQGQGKNTYYVRTEKSAG